MTVVLLTLIWLKRRSRQRRVSNPTQAKYIVREDSSTIEDLWITARHWQNLLWPNAACPMTHQFRSLLEWWNAAKDTGMSRSATFDKPWNWIRITSHSFLNWRRRTSSCAVMTKLRKRWIARWRGSLGISGWHFFAPGWTENRKLTLASGKRLSPAKPAARRIRTILLVRD